MNILLESSFQNVLSQIGDNLYQLRHKRKEKLSSVAISIGISHPVLSQIENGKYEGLSIKLVIKLADYYQVKPEVLLFNIA